MNSDHTWRNASLAAFAAFLLCVLLGDRTGLSLDEYHALISSGLGWRELIVEGVSPLPYVYLRIFSSLGESELILRLGSALAISASVLAVTHLAILLGLRRYLVAIWALSVTQPYWLMIGTQYQYSALLIPTVAFTGAALIQHLQRLTWRTGIVCMLAFGLLFWIHRSAAGALPGVLLFVFMDWRREPKPKRALFWQKAWPVFGGILLALPIFILLRNEALPAKPGGSDGLIVIRRLLEVCFNSDSLWHETIRGLWPTFPLRISHLLLFLEALLVMVGLGLAWKELGGPSSRACRFVLFVFLGIPTVQGMLFIVEPDYRVSAQYLSIASVAWVLIAGVAWGADAPVRWRRLFQILLVLIVAVQLSATCLYKGKYLRETAEWITRQADSMDSLIVSSDDVNLFALKRAGYPDLKSVVAIKRSHEDFKNVRERVRKTVSKHKRGFVLLFATRAPVIESIESLQKRKIILDYRQWNVTSEISLVAWIRLESERGWLRQLNPPILKGLMLAPESRP